MDRITQLSISTLRSTSLLLSSGTPVENIIKPDERETFAKALDEVIETVELQAAALSAYRRIVDARTL